jgi:glycerophosphoryl diester phosphodiesterase
VRRASFRPLRAGLESARGRPGGCRPGAAQQRGDNKCVKAAGLLRVALARRLPWHRAKGRTPPLVARTLKLVSTERPLVIGHRGFCAFAPENTLPSFELALEAGVDLVECDYRQAADGELLVIHDADLDRTTDARHRWGGKRISVTSKTASEIATLDAGRWFDPRYAGTRVPTLSEALDWIAPRGIALLERKSGDVDSLVRVLQETKRAGRVVVQSFDWKFLHALHERLPELPLAALGPLAGLPGVRKAPGVFGRLTGRWLRALRKTGASVVVWNKQVSREAVRQAHHEGLRVWIYTINRPELADHLLDLGVDGLITNNPALIWKTIALRT